MKYVIGSDHGRIGNIFYCVDPMGVFDTIPDAVRGYKNLHHSFGYTIYATEDNPVDHVIRMHGMRSGSKTQGLRIIEKIGYCFDFPEWTDTL